MITLDQIDKQARRRASTATSSARTWSATSRRQYPVPTYVGEFLLGRYCASTDRGGDRRRAGRSSSGSCATAPSEPARRSCSSRAPAKTGSVKIIDLVTARLDAKTDSYLATLPSLQLNDVRIERRARQRARADADRRLLRRGRAGVRRGRSPRRRTAARSASPSLRPIQLSKRDVLERSVEGRAQLHDRGVEATSCCAASASSRECLTERAGRRAAAAHGPVRRAQLQHGRARSARHRQEPPLPAGLALRPPVSGGKATVARMFVNMANGQRGLVCQYDVVCFDEVSGVSFDQKDGVNIMKGYMESGEFSRGRESIRADGSIVMVGNFDVDVEHQQRDRPPVRPAAAGDAQRHRLHGPHPRLPARLGRSEDQPGRCSPTTSAWSATSSPSAGASSAEPEPPHVICRARVTSAAR